MKNKEIITIIIVGLISGIVSVFATEIGKTLLNLTKKNKDSEE